MIHCLQNIQIVANNFLENASISSSIKRLPLKEKLNDKIFTKMVWSSMSIEKQKLIHARMNRKIMKYVKNKIKQWQNLKLNKCDSSVISTGDHSFIKESDRPPTTPVKILNKDTVVIKPWKSILKNSNARLKHPRTAMQRNRRNYFNNQQKGEYKTLTSISPYAYDDESHSYRKQSMNNIQNLKKNSGLLKSEPKLSFYITPLKSKWEPILKPSRNWYMDSEKQVASTSIMSFK